MTKIDGLVQEVWQQSRKLLESLHPKIASDTLWNVMDMKAMADNYFFNNYVIIEMCRIIMKYGV